MIGRRDRQVKLRGFRIELEEIERVAVATGLVNAAFVEKVGEGASAWLVGFTLPARSDDAADDGSRDELPGRLSARLAERLPGYMVPTRWIVLSELPLGPTGKADRAAMLASLARQGTEGRQVAGQDAAEPVSGAIRTILLDVLDVPGDSRPPPTSSSWAATPSSPCGWHTGSGSDWRWPWNRPTSCWRSPWPS